MKKHRIKTFLMLVMTAFLGCVLSGCPTFVPSNKMQQAVQDQTTASTSQTETQGADMMENSTPNTAPLPAGV